MYVLKRIADRSKEIQPTSNLLSVHNHENTNALLAGENILTENRQFACLSQIKLGRHHTCNMEICWSFFFLIKIEYLNFFFLLFVGEQSKILSVSKTPELEPSLATGRVVNWVKTQFCVYSAFNRNECRAGRLVFT